MKDMRLVDCLRDQLVVPQIASRRSAAPVIGICGSQGSGKSTAVAALAAELSEQGLRVAALSLDDFYLPRGERLALAKFRHPLFATRGVPGTHDVDLAIDTIGALARGEAVRLPRFDKSLDEPVGRCEWALQAEGTDLVLFEGWCVGARPQDEEDLEHPMNRLEAVEDPDGRWRRCVNELLADRYQTLFAQLTGLALLAAPSFEQTLGWRQEQEHELRERLAAENRSRHRTMTDSDIVRFVQHYERLTKHILASMPSYADLLIELDPHRAPVRWRGAFDR